MGAESEDVSETIRELMWVERSGGTTLSPSHKSPGGLSPLVHDTKGVQEQVVLHEYDGGEESTGSGNGAADILVKLVIAGAIVGATLVIDRVVIPKVSRYRAARRARKDALSGSRPAGAEVAEPKQTSDLSRLVGDEIEESGTEIDTQQWYTLFFDAVAHRAASDAHRAMSDEKWATLASARVIGDEETQALARAMRELTPEQIGERVDRVLEQHPELLDEDPATVLTKLFGDDVDEALVPLAARAPDIPPARP